MKLLIIGLGYAGTRFLHAFNYVHNLVQQDLEYQVAYVDIVKKDVMIPYYSNVEIALREFDPDIIVVSTNDECHSEILQQLTTFKGFIICEKPLISPQENLKQTLSAINQNSGFCLDMVERYSPATTMLKQYIKQEQLTMVKANFDWAKDRISDYRPTCGVISEVIHPIDLIQYIAGNNAIFKLHHVLGTRSDFSISGDSVLDTVLLTATLNNNIVVTGYSSFTNIVRKREISFVLRSPSNQLIYANMIFDTPLWDMDYLYVWERNSIQDKCLINFNTTTKEQPSELKTIVKLVELVQDVVLFIKDKKQPKVLFADINTAYNLQNILNTIHDTAITPLPIKYLVENQRELFTNEHDSERLG